MEWRPSISSSGRAHHWSGYFSAKPVHTRVRKEMRQQGVLHALKGQHAESGVAGARAWPRRRGVRPRPEPQADQLADPIAAVVQQHQPDGHRDQQQVELAHPAQARPVRSALPATCTWLMAKRVPGAGMALAAGLGQVLGIDGGFRVGRRQNVVHAVATGAVGHRLRPGLGGQTVVGGIEAHQAVRGQAELARQPDVAVATSAGVANVRRVHRRGGVGVFDDLVLAVAIGAERGLGDAARQGLAVDAGAVLLHHLAVAHAAGVRHGGAESLRLGVAAVHARCRGTGRNRARLRCRPCAPGRVRRWRNRRPGPHGRWRTRVWGCWPGGDTSRASRDRCRRAARRERSFASFWPWS